MRKIISLLLILLTVCFFATACQKNEPTSAEIVDSSVKYTFDVDEEFCFNTAKIKVIHPRAEREYSVTREMLSGFDTRTTGTKKFTVTYGEFVMEREYEVVCADFPSRVISTTARITVEQAEYPTGIGRRIYLDIGDLSKVDGVYFTVKCDKEVFNANLNTLDVFGSWDVRTSFVNSKTVKIVLYKNQGTTGSCELAVINFVGVKSAEISLSDILVSDGITENYLPNTKGV